jgi:hypothetical protein
MTPDHEPDPRDARRPCRLCGRTVRYVKPKRGRGYFQHASTDGLRWKAEARRRAL